MLDLNHLSVKFSCVIYSNQIVQCCVAPFELFCQTAAGSQVPTVSPNSIADQSVSTNFVAQSNDHDLGSDEEDYGQPPYTQVPPNTENGSSTSSSNRSSSYSLGTEYTPRMKRRMKSYGAMLCQNLNILTSLMLLFTEVSQADILMTWAQPDSSSQALLTC